jgi:hypothetical protein
MMDAFAAMREQSLCKCEDPVVGSNRYSRPSLLRPAGVTGCLELSDSACPFYIDIVHFLHLLTNLTSMKAIMVSVR